MAARPFRIGILVIVAFAAGLFLARLLTPTPIAPPSTERATVLPDPRKLPPLDLVDQDGRPLPPDFFASHWTLVFFGFTQCPDICPTTLATLAQATRQLADLPEAERPRVLLVSVDPERDPPERLANINGQDDGGARRRDIDRRHRPAGCCDQRGHGEQEENEREVPAHPRVLSQCFTDQAQARKAHAYRRLRRSITRGTVQSPAEREAVARALESSPRLATLYRMPEELARTWERSTLSTEQLVPAAPLVRPCGGERHRDPRGIRAATPALRRSLTPGVGHRVRHGV